MKQLKVENLTKTYGEKSLFENISLTITEGERIGLIGVNGTGNRRYCKLFLEVNLGIKVQLRKQKIIRLVIWRKILRLMKKIQFSRLF